MSLPVPSSHGTGAGRWLTGGTLVVAAVYEVTPLKDGTAALLLGLGIVLMAAPDAVLGLTIPGDGGSIDRMDAMRMP